MILKVNSESKYGIQPTAPAFTCDRRGKSQTLCEVQSFKIKIK